MASDSVPARASWSAALRHSGWFMLVVGTVSLVLAQLGAGGPGTGGALVLAGTSIVLPDAERRAKVSLAVAAAALALAALVSAWF